MIRALSTAATGMEAQQTRLDVTANNIANVSTAGFKKSRAEFQDLMYQTLKAPGVATADGPRAPTGTQVGMGVRNVATERMHTEGDLHQTGNSLDVAIEGHGFFAIKLPAARPATPATAPSSSTTRASWSTPTASRWLRRSLSRPRRSRSRSAPMARSASSSPARPPPPTPARSSSPPSPTRPGSPPPAATCSARPPRRGRRSPASRARTGSARSRRGRSRCRT